MIEDKGLHVVRVESGPTAIFTRVYIDDVEVKGVRRVWFDSGDAGRMRPGHSHREEAAVHIEFYANVHFSGEVRPDLISVRPAEVAP